MTNVVTNPYLLCVELEGTLRNPDGTPVAGAKEALSSLRECRYNIIVRADDENEAARWLVQHRFTFASVSQTRPADTLLYLDRNSFRVRDWKTDLPSIFSHIATPNRPRLPLSIQAGWRDGRFQVVLGTEWNDLFVLSLDPQEWNGIRRAAKEGQDGEIFTVTDDHMGLAGEEEDDDQEEARPTFESFPLTGTRCSVCGESRRETPAGPVCVNGHGGAEPMEEEPISVRE